MRGPLPPSSQKKAPPQYPRQWCLNIWPEHFSISSDGGSRPRCPIHQDGWMSSSSNWLCLECGQSSRERANRHAEQAGCVDKESSNTALCDRWTPTAVQNTGKWSSQSRCTITGSGVRPWLSAPPQTSNEQPNHRYLDECFAGLHLALVILA